MQQRLAGDVGRSEAEQGDASDALEPPPLAEVEAVEEATDVAEGVQDAEDVSFHHVQRGHGVAHVLAAHRRRQLVVLGGLNVLVGERRSEDEPRREEEREEAVQRAHALVREPLYLRLVAGDAGEEEEAQVSPHALIHVVVQPVVKHHQRRPSSPLRLLRHQLREHVAHKLPALLLLEPSCAQGLGLRDPQQPVHELHDQDVLPRVAPHHPRESHLLPPRQQPRSQLAVPRLVLAVQLRPEGALEVLHQPAHVVPARPDLTPEPSEHGEVRGHLASQARVQDLHRHLRPVLQLSPMHLSQRRRRDRHLLSHNDALHLGELVGRRSVCEDAQDVDVGLGDALVAGPTLQRRHELSRLGVEPAVGARELQALARRPLVYPLHHLLALLLSLGKAPHRPQVVLPDLLEQVVRAHAPVDPQPKVRLVRPSAAAAPVGLIEHGGDAKPTNDGDGGADVSEPLTHRQRAALPAVGVALLLPALLPVLR
eukprot:763645-Hanusia_phi.AAC.2